MRSTRAAPAVEILGEDRLPRARRRDQRAARRRRRSGSSARSAELGRGGLRRDLVDQRGGPLRASPRGRRSVAASRHTARGLLPRVTSSSALGVELARRAVRRGRRRRGCPTCAIGLLGGQRARRTRPFGRAARGALVAVREKVGLVGRRLVAAVDEERDVQRGRRVIVVERS